MPKRESQAEPEPATPYHHGDLKRALVEAALQLADHEGLDAVTTRALARQLGVSHAAPARHFPNRGALLAEMAAEAFERFARALSRSAQGLAHEASFSAMGRAYVRFALEHPALMRLMFSPELQVLTAPNPRLEVAANHAYAILRTGARAAVGDTGSDDDVSAAAFLGWSVAHGAAALWLDGPMKSFGPKHGAKARFLAQADQAIDAAAQSMKRAQV